MSRKVMLDQIAIAHSGDKGDSANVAVIPYRYEDYDLLVKQLPASRVQQLYGPIVKGEVVRYLLQGTRILNFLLQQGNSGGSSRSLIVDRHAIARAALILSLDVEVPDDWIEPQIDEYGRVIN